MSLAFSRIKRIAALIAGISVASITTVAQADWSIVGLGTLDGQKYESIRTNAINDSGQVVGYFIIENEAQGFMTGPNGTGIAKMAIDDFVPFDINNSGQVAGSLAAHASITGPNGVGMTNLGESKVAYGINNSGQAVGDSFDLNGHNRAFITGPNGVGTTSLGVLGGRRSHAADINDSGQVVGYSNIIEPLINLSHAFITGPDGVGMTDLGTLGGRLSFATGINESGLVVGRSNSGYSGAHAFITGPDGIGMTDLGTLGGRDSSSNDINDSGEVIGWVRTADGTIHAFLYSHGGMTDLNLLEAVIASGWTNLEVSNINNNGQIVGTGIDITGQHRAFLLSYTPDTVFDPSPILIPVPEPSTYLMLLVGLLGILGWRCKYGT